MIEVRVLARSARCTDLIKVNQRRYKKATDGVLRLSVVLREMNGAIEQRLDPRCDHLAYTGYMIDACTDRISHARRSYHQGARSHRYSSAARRYRTTRAPNQPPCPPHCQRCIFAIGVRVLNRIIQRVRVPVPALRPGEKCAELLLVIVVTVLEPPELMFVNRQEPTRNAVVVPGMHVIQAVPVDVGQVPLMPGELHPLAVIASPGNFGAERPVLMRRQALPAVVGDQDERSEVVEVEVLPGLPGALRGGGCQQVRPPIILVLGLLPS